jgi:hypothetical protein
MSRSRLRCVADFIPLPFVKLVGEECRGAIVFALKVL